MQTVALIGESTLNGLGYVGSLAALGARAAYYTLVAPFQGKPLRLQRAISQAVDVGVRALPILSLITFFIGLILALQAAYELRRFGAMSAVATAVAVSISRELGPLITAIVVIGRSGSAFAAEIGTMSVTEEIDALRVMAFEPVEFVLAPKYLAALIMVPCLTIASNVCGILAGGIFMFFSTHLSLGLYLHYVLTSIQLRDVISGLIKSLAFATIIVHVGCLEGFRVHGGPDAVGRSTTTAVVKSTFLVIVADVIFTAIFYFTGKH